MYKHLSHCDLRSLRRRYAHLYIHFGMQCPVLAFSMRWCMSPIMEDPDELTSAWSDLKVSAGRPPPEMPLAAVSLAGLTFSTVCLHNPDTWINLIPQGRGWRIQGFVDALHLDEGRPFRLYWGRGRQWVVAESPVHPWAESHGSPEVEWLAHELAAELPLAIANKLPTMT